MRWENYESMRPGGSLIVNYTQNNQGAVGQKLSPKSRLDDLYQRQQQQHQMLARHASDEEFRRYNPRPSNALSPGDDLRQPQASIQNLHKNNSKDHKKEPAFFKARNSGGRTNQRLNLKETSSTTATNEQQLHTYKSEKTLPSFIRNQTRSPDRFKLAGKGLSRDSFKVIRRLGEGKFGTVNLARYLVPHTGKLARA